MNLQRLHVKIIRNLRKATTQENYKNFIEPFAIDLLSNEEFQNFFKERIQIFIKYKSEQFLKTIGNKIISTNSSKEIVRILANLKPEFSQKLFEILVHSYLQWKDNFDLDKFSPYIFHNSKIKLVKDLRGAINKQNRKVALLLWGSFLMRKIDLSLFSDIDCALIVDDKYLLSKNRLINFLTIVFKEVGTIHYNQPNRREIEWFRKSQGIARCGFIKNGIFVNFKIFTKKAVHHSVTNFCVQSLKESNQGYFIIPDFNNKSQLSFSKNSIPVYPFVKADSIYKLCRGLIPELLHTGKITVCDDSLLKTKLINIQKDCIAKSMSFIKAYNPHFRQEQIVDRILELSYTPKKEMRNKRKKYLVNFYNKIYKKIGKSIYLEAFLIRLYGEAILPLLEKTSKYWLYHNLLSFFLGVPGRSRSSTNLIKQAFIQYFKTIKKIQNSLRADNVCLITNNVKIFYDILLRLQLNEKEKILLATCLADTIEKFCINRSDFYDLTETMFEKLFPKEFNRTHKILENLLVKIGGKQKLIYLMKNAKRDLKKINNYIIGIEYRIRRPAGLYQHYLMKGTPLRKIDDVVSIRIRYADRNKITKVIETVSKYLRDKFKTNIEKKVLQIEKYRGYHFYFQYNAVPFEVMIRDLRSDTSIEHKIEHSIEQKKYHRLIF